uniref:Uncharacterized protein n=1 Tax=Triticum urartu TaxID=4572 RepID=A0A8R7QL48_TRIUA
MSSAAVRIQTLRWGWRCGSSGDGKHCSRCRAPAMALLSSHDSSDPTLRPCQLLMGPSLQGCPCSPTTSAPLWCSASATAAQ